MANSLQKISNLIDTLNSYEERRHFINQIVTINYKMPVTSRNIALNGMCQYLLKFRENNSDCCMYSIQRPLDQDATKVPYYSAQIIAIFKVLKTCTPTDSVHDVMVRIFENIENDHDNSWLLIQCATELLNNSNNWTTKLKDLLLNKMHENKLDFVQMQKFAEFIIQHITDISKNQIVILVSYLLKTSDITSIDLGFQILKKFETILSKSDIAPLQERLNEFKNLKKFQQYQSLFMSIQQSQIEQLQQSKALPNNIEELVDEALDDTAHLLADSFVTKTAVQNPILQVSITPLVNAVKAMEAGISSKDNNKLEIVENNANANLEPKEEENQLSQMMPIPQPNENNVKNAVVSTNEIADIRKQLQTENSPQKEEYESSPQVDEKNTIRLIQLQCAEALTFNSIPIKGISKRSSKQQNVQKIQRTQITQNVQTTQIEQPSVAQKSTKQKPKHTMQDLMETNFMPTSHPVLREEEVQLPRPTPSLANQQRIIQQLSSVQNNDQNTQQTKTPRIPVQSSQLLNIVSPASYNSIEDFLDSFQLKHKTDYIQLVTQLCRVQPCVQKMSLQSQEKLVPLLIQAMFEGYVDQCLSWIKDAASCVVFTQEQRECIGVVLSKIWEGHPRWADAQAVIKYVCEGEQ